MSAKTTELKPCPFCGSGNVRYKEAEHAVVCARCKARGSIAPDEEMAIRMWDERAGELKPDSWEKLEEDVNLGCRDYCEKYRLEECDYNMRVHMLDRAKKLAGIEEAPGCFDGDPNAPWNQEDEPACGDCAHCIEGCCDYGICELEFEEAFSAQEAKEPMAAWEAAKWARDWIVEHYKNMQEDWCKRFDG